MKPLCLLLAMSLFLTLQTANAQETKQINLADSTGLPGDHFSLQGALGMFKESSSLEDFEKRLNSKDNAVNNLDLNGDGKVDYVRVVADKKENAHILMLQVPVSKTELQDVAVIEIEKSGEKEAYLQILGDEALYGETIMVEPKEDGEPSDPGVMKKGPAGSTYAVPRVFFNVWFWPCVTYIYEPVYVVYISPWYWGFYPPWWDPWFPFTWRYFYIHNYHWHHHYHYAPYHRTVYAHQVYAPRRSASQQVSVRYNKAVRDYKAQQATRPPRPGSMNQTVRPAQPQTKPGVRPTQPQTKPGVRPNEEAPQTKPGVRPTQPQTKPGVRPNEEAPQTKPQTKPGVRPTEQPPARPQQQTKPQKQRPNETMSRPAQKPQSRPAPQKRGNNR